MMQVAIDLADDIAEELHAKWSDLPRHALEALAAEGYRTEALSEEQVRRMLGYESRFQVLAFLKEHGIYLESDLADLEHDGQAGDALAHSDWEDFDAAAKRPLELHILNSFIHTYKPVLDAAEYRSFDTLEAYRR